uniref:Alpha-mannosidase n=1 Tax=Amphimedon queenslandica TaxID=400682 RepID=A0A1X7VKL5_AMPQE
MAVYISSVFLLLLCSSSLLLEVSAGENAVLNVHIVPHTHDDVGWQKTVDEYYYGANKSIAQGSVQYILDSVITELGKNEERKFIYVEMAFFTRWWSEQPDDIKQKVHELVDSGQLEFINGGWCMSDEASTHYNAIIDQMSIGLRFIANTFGVSPSVGWQIDPFGHSSFHATSFSLFGFDSMMFGRLHYEDDEIRRNTSQREIIWKSSPSLGNIADIFTEVLYGHYAAPHGFCFDLRCKDPPIMDDNNLYDDNVKSRVDEFIETALTQAQSYKTNNIIMTMGGDFQYENSREWFENLDKLIAYVNKNGSINVMYSTPSIYTKYVNSDKDFRLSTKSDDFFPYANAPWDYWTGYFTSRPALKGYVRQCNAHLQACKQLEAIHNGMGDKGPSSIKLQQAMGVAQHHDAVSGTEKQHVADDYAKRLHVGEVECRSVMATVLNDLAAKGANAPKMNLSFCEYLNISVCPVTEGGDFSMVVYNSLGRPYTGVVHIPIIKRNIIVTSPDGSAVPVQVVPISNVTKSLSLIVTGDTKAEYVAVFEVTDVPPSGYAIYTSAYIFRPNSSATFPVGSDNNNNAEMTSIMGDLLSEVRQVFSPWVSQVVRLYENRPAVELEYTVGPIPIKDGLGKEIISHFTTDLKSDSTFYTDSNGRDMQKRVRNYRPTWKYNNTEPIAGNYYPVNSRIYIRDEKKGIQFTVLNDRSQGGSSITDGSVELMVHRRLLYDDKRGVGEPLDELGVNGKGLIIRGKHLLILDTIDDSAYTQRMMAEELMMTPELSFTLNNGLQLEHYNLMYNGLSIPLPDNVHLLTLEHLDQSTILLRLDHQFESTDPEKWSTTANVKLKDLFVAFEIKEVTELGLGGNLALSDIKKLQWQTTDNETVPGPFNFPPVTGPDFIVSLSPMMIRTFNITIETRN